MQTALCDSPPVSPVASPSPHPDGSDHPGDLNPRQLRLLAALVTSTDVQAACAPKSAAQRPTCG